MDFFKAVASGLVEGTAALGRAVVEVPVAVVVGAAEGIQEAYGKAERASSAAEAFNAGFSLAASPFTGALVGGTKEIAKTPEKVVHSIANGVEKALED